MLFGDGPKGNKFANASVGENNIDSPLHVRDGLVKTIKVSQLGNVSLNSRNVGRVVKKLEWLEIAQLRILHRLPFRMGFSDLETAPTISLSRSYRLQGNLRCFGRACSPMSLEQSIKNSCCETSIWRRRTGS